MMRRIAPALFLLLLSPLVAEFLLGDFTLSVLPLLLALVPMYGGGALLIREVVRRTRRGWPSIVLLAMAFGLVEEGITTQSLFDPDYAGAHLLEHGYVPALGIAVPWTIFVLTLHTVWSISVPIALVEESTSRRTEPWLGRVGLGVAALLLVVGCGGTFAQSYGTDHYLAGWPQLSGVVVVALALVVAAFRAPRSLSRLPGSAPHPAVVLATALVAGALFETATALSPGLDVAAMVLALVGVGGAVLRWSRRLGWGPSHRLATAAGGLLTYAWHSFSTSPLIGGGPVATPVSHVALALAAVVLLVVLARRRAHRETSLVQPRDVACSVNKRRLAELATPRGTSDASRN